MQTESLVRLNGREIEAAQEYLQHAGLKDPDKTSNIFNEMYTTLVNKTKPGEALLIITMLLDTVIMNKDLNADQEARRLRALELTMAFYNFADLAEVVYSRPIDGGNDD